MAMMSPWELLTNAGVVSESKMRCTVGRIWS